MQYILRKTEEPVEGFYFELSDDEAVPAHTEPSFVYPTFRAAELAAEKNHFALVRLAQTNSDEVAVEALWAAWRKRQLQGI